jgi:hypothetical protein
MGPGSRPPLSPGVFPWTTTAPSPEPFDAAETAFRLLCAGPQPLALHASKLAAGLPDRPVPLDELRVRENQDLSAICPCRSSCSPWNPRTATDSFRANELTCTSNVRSSSSPAVTKTITCCIQGIGATRVRRC